MAKKIPFFTTLPGATVREIKWRARTAKVPQWQIVHAAIRGEPLHGWSDGGPRRKARGVK